jgi:hypothetical protein
MRARALDEIAHAHAAVGGTARGRRYATQQINRAYAVMLASHFQGFCRDLHSECVDGLLAGAAAPLHSVIQAEFTWGRQLDRGNARPDSLAADFGRFGLALWTEVVVLNPRNVARRGLLEELNTWRNAIAHQQFDPVRLGGTNVLRLSRVRRWRAACHGLARALEVMRRAIHRLSGVSPW